MTVVWSEESLEDMERIYEFHAKFSVPVARRVMSMIRRATGLPKVFPQAGRSRVAELHA
jgi:plasmid stabilization system protein ParE